MPELSNLLRQKLGEGQNGGGTHPDADTLTALTERLLPAAERQGVLAHLAACGQCREVVALSQPQLPELVSQPVRKPASVSGWRKLFTPTFGLAATAAAMAIIAVVVLQTPHKTEQPSQPNSEAKNTQPANAIADKESNPSMTAQPESAPPAVSPVEPARSRTSNESATVTATAAPAPPPVAAKTLANSTMRQPAIAGGQPVLRADSSKKDFVNPGIIFAANSADSFSGNVYNNFATNGNGLPVAPQPQPSASEARLSTNAQLTIFKDLPPRPAVNKNDMHLLRPTESADHFWNLGKIVQKGRGVLRHTTPSAPAINGNALAFSAMGGPGISADLQKQQPSEIAAAPEKPASIDGLQRFEGLNRSAMATAEADSAAVLWKVLGGKLVKSSGPGQWEDAYPGASFQFAIVSSRGNEVWAGGTQASVIHSRDGGKTWEAAKLGNTASGTVVSILFSGNIVQVKTSEDQSWLSSDGGKTWAQN